MRKRTRLCAAIFALAAFSGTARADAFSDISAALAAGNGVGALALTDTALGQAGLSSADRARLLVDRGFAHQLQGDSAGAMADLSQAINANSLTPSEQAHAYLERGLIMDSMNRLDDAVGDYGAALRLDPGSATALNNRGNAYRRQNRFEDAKRDYMASLAADNPAPEYPYYGLGQIAESEGKLQDAKNFYVRAVAANQSYNLAADRLAALGGTPSPAPAIALRPPASASPQSAPLVLHPPAPKVAMAKPPVRSKPAPAPDRQPGLRPTLDAPKGAQVQLGAWREEEAAKQGWSQAVKAADGALSGLTPHFVAVDLPGKGRYYRLRVETSQGRQLCAVLAAKGLTCIPVGN